MYLSNVSVAFAIASMFLCILKPAAAGVPAPTRATRRDAAFLSSARPVVAAA